MIKLDKIKDTIEELELSDDGRELAKQKISSVHIIFITDEGLQFATACDTGLSASLSDVAHEIIKGALCEQSMALHELNKIDCRMVQTSLRVGSTTDADSIINAIRESAEAMEKKDKQEKEPH